jgi:Acetyltransferase (GNAT) domain
VAGSWHRDPDLAGLEGAWRAAGAAGSGSVFQEFAFSRRWAQIVGREAEIAVWTSRDAPLVVPLAIRGGRLGLIGEGLFDYLDLIGGRAREAENEAAEAAHSLVWRKGRSTGIPEASLHHGFWRRLAGAARPYSAAPVRAAGGDLEREHARAAWRWAKAGAELTRAEDGDARRRLLAWLLDRKARGLAARGQASVIGRLEQAWIVAMVEHEACFAELWELRRRGERLAALLCWRDARTRYAYTIAYDPGAAALSPGVLALYGVLRHTMKEGRCFNFLTGEQAFKLRFATHRERLLRYEHER